MLKEKVNALTDTWMDARTRDNGPWQACWPMASGAKKLLESIDRCTGRSNITKILLNTTKSISHLTLN